MEHDAPLSLHIPTPPARPGDTNEFAHIDIGEAGLVVRPDPTSPESELRSLPFELIRVLGNDNQAHGPWDPRLDPHILRKALRAIQLTRSFDDRFFRLHRQGKTSFYMKSRGEEAIAVAQSLVLSKHDMCFPTYRVIGWLHARGYPLVDMANQIFSNAADPLRGRQLPILFSARDYGFYSLSGNVGSRIGHAVGWAMASAYKRDVRLALAYIGEGSTAEGDFHEALTFASVYRAPAILCVTNNQWAISSFSGIAGAEATTFAAKAIAYGIPGLRVDGNDFLAIWGATCWARERARANLGPTLIELFTYRVGGHSTSDDPNKYRPKDEPQQWPLGDPLVRLQRHLIEIGEWDASAQTAMECEIECEVRHAVKKAEKVGTLGKSKPPVSEMFEDVFESLDWRLVEQRLEAGAA